MPTHPMDKNEFYMFMSSAPPWTSTFITYMDSAASNHSFVNKSDFESYELYSGKERLAAESGRKFPIHEKGMLRK